MSYGLGAYKKTSVQTASKEQILLMLYQAAIKNCKKAIEAIEQKNIAGKGVHIGKLQDIVIELNRRIDSLNQQYHMQTPRLGAIVFPKRGALGGYRFRRDRLSADGCHLTDFTTQKWIDLLKTNADTNRHRFYTNYNEDFSDNDLADISTDKIDYEIDTLSNISDISTTPSGRGLELHYNQIEGYARLCLSQGLIQV